MFVCSTKTYLYIYNTVSFRKNDYIKVKKIIEIYTIMKGGIRLGDYTAEEIYNMLSDEDKAALEHGQKMCCRSRRKKKLKTVLLLSTCVAIATGIFLIKIKRQNLRISFEGGK